MAGHGAELRGAIADFTEADAQGMLAFVEQLSEVNVDGVEPMTSPVATKLPMREDVVSEPGDAARILANAPKSERGFFVVPKVVE